MGDSQPSQHDHDAVYEGDAAGDAGCFRSPTRGDGRIPEDLLEEWRQRRAALYRRADANRVGLRRRCLTKSLVAALVVAAVALIAYQDPLRPLLSALLAMISGLIITGKRLGHLWGALLFGFPQFFLGLNFFFWLTALVGGALLGLWAEEHDDVSDRR